MNFSNLTEINGAFHFRVTEKTVVGERLDVAAVSVAIIVKGPISDEL